MVNKFLGEEYAPLSKTVKRYTENLLITAASSFTEWAFGKTAKEIFDWGVVYVKVQNCIPGATEKCSSRYNWWIEQVRLVRLHKERYAETLQQCSLKENEARQIRAAVAFFGNRIVEEENIKKQIEAKKLLVEKEYNVIKVNHAFSI